MKSNFRYCLFVGLLALVCCSTVAHAQNKDIEKGKDLVTKAMSETDQTKRAALLQKADEMFREGGMKKEQYVIIGDAFLGKNDFLNAYNYYNRCDKPEKKEGMKRLGEAQLNAAMEVGEKEQPKMLKKALDYYTKGDAAKEGAIAIGDRFYEKGFDFYPKALEYYLLAQANGKVDRIAAEYKAKGGDFEWRAAETYAKLKTEEGFGKSGDIYFERKEYLKAFEAYTAGNVTSGLRKYADYLYSQNQNAEADALYVKLAEAYGKKGEADEVEKLANTAMAKGSYKLAATMYDRAENTAMSNRCLGYAKLVEFQLDSAKTLFASFGEPAMAKGITDNEKPLRAIADANETLDMILKGQPFISQVYDTLTGRINVSPEDMRTLEEYYRSVKNQILDAVYGISTNFQKINNAEVKKYIRLKLVSTYPAVGRLLDRETLTIKIPKDQAKSKDTFLIRL